MAPPLRIDFPGAVYHITSRGNAREAIALADDDREDFIQVPVPTKGSGLAMPLLAW